MVKKRIIAGNWKLYIEDKARAKKVVSAVKRAAGKLSGLEVVLMPTAPLISVVADAVKGSSVAVGAQAVQPFEKGAYTGYVSPVAVKNAGASWTLVGHSERRQETLDGISAAGESDAEVAAQVRAAHEAGIKIMLCIGEVERDAGGAHFSVIEQQLTSALSACAKTNIKLAIAYEPVWAIGKSAEDAMKPADLEEMTIFIRRTLAELFGREGAVKIPILYGGSVDSTNARELLAQGGVAGFLVGRASADEKSFIELLQACTK